jgi:hypothetical protein
MKQHKALHTKSTAGDVQLDEADNLLAESRCKTTGQQEHDMHEGCAAIQGR